MIEEHPITEVLYPSRDRITELQFAEAPKTTAEICRLP